MAANDVVVVGHRNPDNDAICAAVGYAYLKSRLDPSTRYIPCRQGPLPDETVWVLERMGLPAPELIKHIHARVRDAMTPGVISIRGDDIMLHAGRRMREHDIRALVVNDADGKYMGIVTERKLAQLYIDEIDVVDTVKSKFKLGNIVRACGGELLFGDPDTRIDGHLRVAAAEPATFERLISPGDVVVMGDRYRSQRIALERGVGCLVLAVGARPDEEIERMARERKIPIICAEQDTFTVTRLATLSQSVSRYIDTDAVVLDPDAILAEVVPDILHSHQREGVVLDDGGRCIGIITRTDIASLPHRRVILVDHNEKAQSVPGIDEADVVEIVDHHRVGDIQTAAPIRFLSLPWGSSATIVAEQYRVNDVDMPVSIAGALLSAVLTDTVLLKSPTATDMDRRVARRLGNIIGVDPIEFGIELFERRGNDESLPIGTLVMGDSKEFEIGDRRILIAQHETANHAKAMARAGEIQEFIEGLLENSGFDVVLFLLTDIIKAGSQFFVAGNRKVIERAFGIDLSDGSVWVDGVLSRKKQVVARLMRA